VILDIFKTEIERISKLNELSDAADVYSLLKGKGKLVWMRDTTLALKAVFVNGVTSFFTPSGKLDNNDVMPTTFSEPVLVVPASALLKLLKDNDTEELVKQIEGVINGTKID